jgi:hypothetical protein
LRAALTAASTSFLEPCETCAMRFAVAGLLTSKVAEGFVHTPAT